ncbi:hypothetical protein GOBAR_DD19233 [Gossypium barbadense]|nr:hypothetical protein GOBAR_DD19233 [Gossypium barbadense]
MSGYKVYLDEPSAILHVPGERLWRKVLQVQYDPISNNILPSVSALDRWIGNLSLQLRFPRIFALAIKKKERSLNSGIGLMVSGLGTSNSQDQPLIGKSNMGGVLAGYAPPKIEIFVWSRIPAKVELAKRNIIPSNACCCPLVAWWFKAKWPDSKASFDDILRFPHLIARSSKRWQSPQSGFLKFNVDGAA